MKKTPTLFLFMVILTMTACAPKVTAAPMPLPITVPPAIIIPPTETPTGLKHYQNDAFGLGFQYPPNWFGPEEYISDQDLRVEIGSDKVYPYGTDRMEQIRKIRNSYYILIQYSKNSQNQYWKDIYQSLFNLQDGESLADASSLTIRVRQFNLGRFKGIEYISTLSETAQTEPVYARQVILIDEQSNLLTITGFPNNVEVGNGAEWRDVYQMIDEANLVLFHEVMELVTIE